MASPNPPQYTLVVSTRARRNLKHLPATFLAKIGNIIDGLKSNPFPQGSEPVRGRADSFRIRVGKYRILYEVHQNNSMVRIVAADLRGQVYKRK